MSAVTFDELLEATGLPEPALAPLREKWNETLSLITKNNERVAQVNAAKAQDPNNVEYIDSLWKAHAKSTPETAELEEKFDAVAEEYEKLLKQLREFGRTKVQPPLSDDEAKKVKAAVNESAPVIQAARQQFSAMAMMVDGYLTSLGKGIEGGLASLLPEADSLKNTRGRKAAGSGGVTYMTRIGFAELNGRNIQRDGKINFRYLADSVSNEFGADKFPENKVTGDQLEIAFFEKLGKELRSIKGPEIPLRTEFDFTKEVKTGESTTETKTVKIAVGRTEETEKVEAKSATGETAKPETAKPEANSTEAKKTEAPAAPVKQAPAKQAPPATQAKK